MADADTSPAVIQVRVERVGQLFDAFDPLPLRERDLSRTAEDYIVGWARELPRRRPIHIVVYAPPGGEGQSDELADALRHYFSDRAERLSGDLKELFRVGRISLAIGVSVLALCIIVGQRLTAGASDSYVARFFNEGLIIVGWVANWRPIEILLYDWWPIARQRALYRRLAVAKIVLEDGATANSAPAAASAKAPR